uniref:Tungstate uptake system ATP-binding protein TupC n=1 Tax=Peptoclostridium acidaminophilum TaxID=1731 RepID=TUPC_PEPAC|nr:RecName: Full=Tungstate uptake system ATP-binding protein TupC [Peptoclostridium acidaminophilum]CAC40784.1 ATPase component of tungstate ABC transporter [Peptoclostridium acidaminophilum]
MQITVSNLKKSYGGSTVLDVESLTFESGKITGIIGPNGAGKTTLLNIISGIDMDFEGDVEYSGSDYSEVKRDITMVFQKGGLLKRSVFENIAYPLKLRGTDKNEIQQTVVELMRHLGIEELSSKKAHKLSGGETQRVALARALAIKPRALLLDEPTASIDPEYMETIEKCIVDYNRKSKATILIITHSMDQARRLCDNIVFLESGRVGEADGFF